VHAHMRTRARVYTHTHTHIYICVCVCVSGFCVIALQGEKCESMSIPRNEFAMCFCTMNPVQFLPWMNIKRVNLGSIIPFVLVNRYRIIIQMNTKLKTLYAHLFTFYDLFRPFCSAFVRYKHKYIIGNLYCGTGIEFAISARKYSRSNC
jgi:hypothetical protein